MALLDISGQSATSPAERETIQLAWYHPVVLQSQLTGRIYPVRLHKYTGPWYMRIVERFGHCGFHNIGRRNLMQSPCKLLVLLIVSLWNLIRLLNYACRDRAFLFRTAQWEDEIGIQLPLPSKK